MEEGAGCLVDRVSRRTECSHATPGSDFGKVVGLATTTVIGHVDLRLVNQNLPRKWTSR